ncbi:MAG: hypothetical protein ACP5T0_03080 [Verrucomicrobiia bacterium]
MKIRILNNSGIQRFKEYINNLRSGYKDDNPNLKSDVYSTDYEINLEIDCFKRFETRLDIGAYLSELFKNHNIKKNEVVGKGTEGLWTWLAYIWFDQITNNKSKICRFDRYICNQSWNRYYVHLIFGAYYIYESLGRERAKLFLSTPPYILHDINDHLACYQYIVGYPNIVDVAIKLYWDEKNNKVKTGIGNKERPGYIRRFPKIIRQLQLNYDLYSMPTENILKLLPPEYDNWIKCE